MRILRRDSVDLVGGLGTVSTLLVFTLYKMVLLLNTIEKT